MKISRKAFDDKIDSLAITYFQTDGANFQEIYDFHREYHKDAFKRDARNFQVNVHDVEAVYDDTLTMCLLKWSGNGQFCKYFTRSIKNGLKDLYKEAKRYRETFAFTIDSSPEKHDSSDTPEDERQHEDASDFNLESDVLFGDTEKSRMVQELYGLADEKTKPIVLAFLTCKNRQEVSDKLGIHHETVKRRINKLNGLYNRCLKREYGEIQDYFQQQN